MKTVLLSITISLLALFNLQAQSDEYKKVICVNVGQSLVGKIMESAGSIGAGTYSTPAFQGTFDYSVTNVVSIGFGVSYQQLGLEYSDYVAEDNNTYSFKASSNRLNLAIRPTFHYGNTGKFDMYSGLRIGMTNWLMSIDTDVPGYDIEEDFGFSGNNLSLQIILYGLRYYVTDNIGANFELAVGSPHYISGGINYRF